MPFMFYASFFYALHLQCSTNLTFEKSGFGPNCRTNRNKRITQGGIRESLLPGPAHSGCLITDGWPERTSHLSSSRPPHEDRVHLAEVARAAPIPITKGYLCLNLPRTCISGTVTEYSNRAKPCSTVCFRWHIRKWWGQGLPQAHGWMPSVPTPCPRRRDILLSPRAEREPSRFPEQPPKRRLPCWQEETPETSEHKKQDSFRER